ncbi:uncharacterized protein [Mytilus edulis]|uniref:uncharacterized protein n=1 Tax=Mytilus edulis TaxID=6550 RepID=UPI0039EF5DC6
MMSTWTLFFLFHSVMAVSWPSGTYTLIKPKSGCPSNWKIGWRHQDNEDNNNQNSVSSPHHFAGSFGRNTKMYYCTKNTYSGSGSWPKGNYCILKYGSYCPSGFSNGSIYWDDEDSNNANDKGGVLPSGTYDRNTRINYCCRSDGSSSTAIRLPTSRPFYLLRFVWGCQRVIGMNVREEFVKTDDEDYNNANSFSGSHPLKFGTRNTQLFYCFYY